MKINNNNTPKLRFIGFERPWDDRKFNYLFERITQKNTENNQNILTISAQQGLVKQETFFTKLVAAKNVTGYYLLKKNDYAYNKSYSKGFPFGAIKRLANMEKGIVSTLYICFRSKKNNELFFDQLFESGKLNLEIKKIAQEGARNHGLLNMSVVDFFNIGINIPSGPEQKKIADFLTSVDEKISTLENKLELMQKYKKGIMQQIFSQKIRFKDENGKDFPEWEEKKLNDLLIKSFVKNRGTYVKLVQSVSNKNGFINQTDQFKDHVVASKDLSNYYVIEQGTFAYNPSRIDVGSLAYKFDSNTSVVSPLYVCFKTKSDFMVDTYLLNWFSSSQFQKQMQNSFEGSVRNTLSYDSLKNMKMKVPIKQEQQKISDFLTSMDEKIETQQEKLKQAKQFKKALLQRMFV